LSEQVRTVLLAWTGPQDPITDALLFNAARRQLVNDIIRPALDTGQTVISDRFADSTLAYQGYGAGAPLDALHRLAHIATDGLEPNRTVLLDLPVEMGLQRRRGGPADQLTRFETDGQNDRAFHERVRAGYLEMAAADPQRWRVVDATASPAVVAHAVWEAVRDLVEP
jgi:dTMP kinase